MYLSDWYDSVGSIVAEFDLRGGCKGLDMLKEECFLGCHCSSYEGRKNWHVYRDIFFPS